MPVGYFIDRYLDRYREKKAILLLLVMIFSLSPCMEESESMAPGKHETAAEELGVSKEFLDELTREYGQLSKEFFGALIGKYVLSDEEYARAKELIKSLNYSVYASLFQCEQALGKLCVRVAHQSERPGVFIRKVKDEEYPVIVLDPSVMKEPDEEQQKARLKVYVEMYVALRNYNDVIMKAIRKISPQAYERLLECAKITGSPCWKFAKGSEKTGVFAGNEATEGYPVIIFDRKIQADIDFHRPHLDSMVKPYIDQYNALDTIPDISQDERDKVLEIIKSLAPELYDEMIKSDPKGVDHIIRFYAYFSNAGMNISPKDGLPLISVGPSLLEKPYEEQRSILAHELGHYVLGHTLEELEYRIPAELTSFKEPFKEPFRLAYSRNQEYEADRFAVIEMEANIDALIAHLRKGEELQARYKVERRALKSTHPLEKARIEYLENLKREIELRKQRNIPRPQIKWRQLADEYLLKLRETSRWH
jgi:Zn-dependent peptidase ImmA (M78 family)